MSLPEIKEGDTIYAVGPGHHSPRDAMDLRIYSARVKSVELSPPTKVHADLKYGCPDVLLEIELDEHRPFLGFPQWFYKSYDVGNKIHLSAADAVRAYEAQAQRRLTEAARAQKQAEDQIAWAQRELAGVTTP